MASNVPTGSNPMDEQSFHYEMDKAYSLQTQDRKAFEKWIDKARKEGWRRPNDPNFNAYYVAAKLPPSLYQRFYSFCKTNNWSKSTAIKFAIHQLFCSDNV